VLIGDAAHTAHFSVGSGTKLAMEDAIALAQAFERRDERRGSARRAPAIAAALRQYEQARKPRVEALQAAAAESQRYFEHTSRYQHFDPLQFTFHLLTRSGRITYDNLKQRDPYFVGDVDRWFITTNDNGQTRYIASLPTNDNGQTRYIASLPTNDERQTTDKERQRAETPDTQHPTSSALLLAPPALWAPLALRAIELPNRVVLAAAATDAATDGLPDAMYAQQLARLAGSGAGMLLTAQAAVSAEGRITPGCAGMYRPEHMAAWAKIVQALHAGSPAKLALWLSHAGRRGATRARTRGVDIPLRTGSWPLLAPSALAFAPGGQVPTAMDQADMERVRGEFEQSARLAAEAGFDILALDMAHGYLLASFLSPLANQREDDYGGDLGCRMRYPLEVFDAVRAAWPADKPLAVALLADDCAPGGLTLDDAALVARALKDRGCDLIAAYAGQSTIGAHPSYDAGASAQLSDVLRNEARIPTLATGYMTTSDQLNTLLAGGRADLCLFYPST
jgi:anthraniloyl-CoA monooxygenase